MADPKTTVEEAQEIIRKHTERCQTRLIPVENSGGFVLAEDIEATEPVQPFRNAAMDGVAVRYEEAKHATDLDNALELGGEVAAGDPGTIDVHANECVRIMTGAPVPEELDTVIRREDIVLEEKKPNGQTKVYFTRLPSEGEGDNIRNAGEDIEVGEMVLRKNKTIRPYELGVGILSGRSQIEVYEKPDVAVISTGDELVKTPGKALGPGQVRDINRFTLAEGVRQAGGNISHVSSLPDDRQKSLSRMRELIQNHRVVITSGGVSMGEYDFINDTLNELDVEFLFHKVWQKPGKPLGFGVENQTLFFALPGNVVSSMVNFEIYVRPTILRMRGIDDATRQHRFLEAGKSFPETDRRTFFFRGKYIQQDTETCVVPTGTGQGSHIMTSLAEADCLVEIPPQSNVESGNKVSVWDLNEPTPINVKG